LRFGVWANADLGLRNFRMAPLCVIPCCYWSHPNIPTSHSVKLRLSDVVPKIGLKAFRIYITLQFPYFLAGVNSLALSLIVID
jgi:hypothetical protein